MGALVLASESSQRGEGEERSRRGLSHPLHRLIEQPPSFRYLQVLSYPVARVKANGTDTPFHAVAKPSHRNFCERKRYGFSIVGDQVIFR